MKHDLSQSKNNGKHVLSKLKLMMSIARTGSSKTHPGPLAGVENFFQTRFSRGRDRVVQGLEVMFHQPVSAA